jgi:formimidoylglutamase
VIAPGRFAQAIRTDAPDGCAVMILGMPDDLGVAMNGGRVGAAAGPAAIRAALARFGTSFDAARNAPMGVAVYDAGDVVPATAAEFGGDAARALDETHRRVREAAAWGHARGMSVVALGGGHDLTYPAVRALAEAVGRPVAGINVDAHLDVRETAGSGMGFRRLIEGDHVEPSCFVEYGIGRFVNLESHVRWAEERGVSLVDIETALDGEVSMREAFHIAFGRGEHNAEGDGVGFVSIDLDAIDASAAPGVSAPNPMGLTAAHAVEAARLAGVHRGVRHMDIMELNPAFDVDGRTARIGALLALTFIAGHAERA